MKALVSLPNGVTISLEATQPGEVRSLLDAVLKDLPVALLQEHLPERSKNVSLASSPAQEAADTKGVGTFRDFCGKVDPVGDMRRVVVAVEGAKRFLDMEKVSPAELEQLFDYVGWPLPSNPVLTMRNAGRKSFGWMERVPGRLGYYTVTSKGLQAVLGGG